LTVFVLLAALLGGLFFVTEHRQQEELSDRLRGDGATTLARVTRMTPRDHNYVYYEFQLGGRSYTGWGNVGEGNPPAEKLRPGDSIVVTYLRSDPTVSVLGDWRGLERR